MRVTAFRLFFRLVGGVLIFLVVCGLYVLFQWVEDDGVRVEVRIERVCEGVDRVSFDGVIDRVVALEACAAETERRRVENLQRDAELSGELLRVVELVHELARLGVEE